MEQISKTKNRPFFTLYIVGKSFVYFCLWKNRTNIKQRKNRETLQRNQVIQAINLPPVFDVLSIFVMTAWRVARDMPNHCFDPHHGGTREIFEILIASKEEK